MKSYSQKAKPPAWKQIPSHQMMHTNIENVISEKWQQLLWTDEFNVIILVVAEGDVIDQRAGEQYNEYS